MAKGKKMWIETRLEKAPSRKRARAQTKRQAWEEGVVLARFEISTAMPNGYKERQARTATKLLSSIGSKVSRPGVVLRHRSEVPLYSADPSNPKIVIQRVGKRKQRGRFVAGRFKAISP